MHNSTYVAPELEEGEILELDEVNLVSDSRNGAVEGCSSQSSSATNGEPNTPLSQHNAEFPVHIKDNAEGEISLEGMDPHLSRLLSALTVSTQANGPISEQKRSTPLAKSSEQAQLESMRNAVIAEIDDTSERPLESTQSPGISRNAVNITNDSLPGFAQFNASPSMFAGGLDTIGNQILVPASQARITVHNQRLAQANFGDRRTKQLALLESLASDPSYPAPVAPDRVSQIANSAIHSGFRAQMPYAPSSSVPPLPVMGHQFIPQHPGLVQPTFPLHISNLHPPHLSHPPPQPFSNQPIYRPSTSATIVPPSSAYQFNALPPPDFSHINGRNGPLHYHPQVSMVQPSVLPVVNNPVNPLRVVVPPSSGLRDLGPLTAPPISPNFYPIPDPRDANRQSLLSILNSNNSIATDAVQPNYSSINQVTKYSNQGVSNGIMHR